MANYPDDIREGMTDFESAECRYCEFCWYGYCEKHSKKVYNDGYCDDYKESDQNGCL